MYLKKELYGLIKTDESIFDFIQESALDGLWYWDLENPENEWMNAKFWTVLGYNPDEMPHKSAAWQNIINQDDLKLASDNFTKHCENPNHPYDQVVRYTHSNGSTVWIRCRGMAIRDKDGKPIRMLGAHQDVSDIKNREQELIEAKEKAEESEKNLSITLNSIGDGVITTDKFGMIDKMNPVALNLCGWHEDEIKGKPLTEVFNIINAYTRKPVSNPVEKVIENGEIVGLANHTVLVAKDGREYQIADSAAPIKDKDGNIKGIVLVFSDVSEKYAAEKEIRFQAHITANSPVITAYHDKELNMVWANKAYQKAIGLSLEEIKGRKCYQVWNLSKPCRGCSVIKATETGRNAACELTPYNQEHWPESHGYWLSQATPVRDAQGVIIGAIEFAIDITERKQSERVIQEKSEEITAQNEELNQANVELIAAIKKAEEGEIALKHSHDLMQYIIEHNRSSVAVHNKDFKYIYVSKRYLEEYKLKEIDILGKHHYDVFPDLPQKWRDVHKKALAGEVISAEDDPYYKDDGTVEWTRWECRPWYEKDNSIGGFIVYTEVITKRKKLELELKKAKEKAEESEERFNLAMKASNDGIFDWNLETNEIYYSPGWKKMLGYEDHDLPNDFSIWTDLTEPEDVKKSWELQQKLISKEVGRFVMEFKMKHKNGNWVDILSRAEAIFNDDGKAIRIVGTHTDITESKEAEEALRKSEAFKKKMVSNIGDVVVIIDQNGINRYKSPNITKLFGWNPEELVGRNTWDNIHPDDVDAGQQFFSTILTEPNAEGLTEMRYKHKDGHYVWIEINVINLLHDKDIQGILGNYHDITDRKNTEQELIAAKEKAQESDRLKSAFLANMSHEIRTPMNGILGFTELLREPDLSSEQKDAYIDIVNQSGQRMLNTVNDIIEISKIEAGIVTINLEEVDVQERLDELIRFFTPESTKKGLKLILENKAPKAVAIISTDQNKIDSIFTNLIKNAIKYTQAGEIRVGSAIVETHSNVSLQFYVKDTGIGIPDKRQHAVFERFTKADILDKDARQGSGLGLAITKAYVEMLGGEIRMESKINEGSTFFFTLPLNGQVHEKTGDLNLEEKNSQTKGLNIVIAEDDETSALYLQTILHTVSSKIRLTKNGNETVEACRNNPDIDLVLMDIQMPDMNGYEATRQIREFNKDVVIIAQTSFALAGDREKAINAGCNDYIAKPVKKVELQELIQKHFGK